MVFLCFSLYANFITKYMKIFSFALLVILVFAMPNIVVAHQSGCHRWHSCPSDSGSYICGDLGYYSECPGGYPAPKPTPLITSNKATVKVVTKTIVSKDAPAVVDRLFRSVYNRKPTIKESTYWKMRARKDKKTEASLKAEMQAHKKKEIKH